MAPLETLLMVMLVVAGTATLCAATSMTNSWAVQVQDGWEAAEALAKKHGFVNLGLVSRSSSRTLSYLASS